MTLDTTRYLADAAHYPGGHAAGVVVPRSTAEIPEIVRRAGTILPIGAQSSLTGGATPLGELVLSTEKLTRILEIDRSRIHVEAGVPVAAMQEALASAGAWFPPAPTFTGAVAGGIVSTNAAGAATFKYGSVRPWVDALTIVLANGEELTLSRGAVRADNHRLVLPDAGRTAVPLPTYRMPDVAKRSAGYHAAADMDAIDLFIGSEGTLGVITAVTFRVASPVPVAALAFVPCRSEAQAFALVGELRRQSLDTWRTRDPHGVDACAVEHVDRRCLDIVREDRADRKHDIQLPPDTEVALLIQLELPPGTSEAVAFEQIATAADEGGGNGPIGRFVRLLAAHDALDDAEIALPGNRRRWDQFVALREAVPEGVNRRVGVAQRDDARISKTAADMIVPFDRFPEMMRIYRDGFRARHLDVAIWGHVSDGNVHPNVIPRSYDDVVRGREAILEFGREVARLGGCPLAEHGVGRNAVKQALLRELYGEEGVEQMRAVKRAVDPAWKLAPGVIFPAQP